jgi:hypothetical protein
MIDCYDNRTSMKVIKGDIVETQMLTEGGYEHVCITLNTGYNFLIELGAWEQIKRYIESGVHEE